MDLETARTEAKYALGRFVGLVDFTTEVLNDIENVTNYLIWTWQQEGFFVLNMDGRVVNGIKVWYDPFDGYLRTEFRLAEEIA